MKILAIGDVCGHAGCDILRELLPSYKRANGIDLVIANGENSADGNGILPASADHIFASGVDVITGGNHTLRRREIYDILDENERLLRPANFPDAVPGRGMTLVDMGHCAVAVINLIGVVYMDSEDCPFRTADRLVNQAREAGAKTIIVDFHAEATSEKRALGLYLDGRVSAVFGTHTHVPTADEQILPLGTGYITDVGMTGPTQSVLGVDPDIVIERFVTHIPIRFKNAPGPCAVSACVFEIDPNSGKAVSVQRVSLS